MFSQNAQGKRTAHVGDCLLNSLNDISFIFTGDQMGNNLCIRFGREMASAGNQLFFEVQVVFDNPVVHDRELLAFIGVGVGVLVGRFTVSRPAGVPDSGTSC
ncbi:hypothetical protein D3C80_1769470 [compost metagenome]